MLKLKIPFHLVLILVVTVFLSSCNTFAPPVTVPAYGHIDSIPFTSTYSATTSTPAQGTASSNIQYAWVYLDDNPVGAFQMPCTFPIVASNGNHNILIYSGIAVPGLTSNAAASINPFYQYYSVSVNLQQGSTINFHPSSTYYTWVKFPYMEDFDQENSNATPNHLSEYTGSLGPSDTQMVVTHDPSLVFQGQGSGMAIVQPTANHNYFMAVTDTLWSLPNSSIPVFMEFNYRCTTSISVGVFDGDLTNESSPIAIFYPTTTWKKMYVALNSTIATFSIKPLRVYFAMTGTSPVADTLLLDNIKILD